MKVPRRGDDLAGLGGGLVLGAIHAHEQPHVEVGVLRVERRIDHEQVVATHDPPAVLTHRLPLRGGEGLAFGEALRHRLDERRHVVLHLAANRSAIAALKYPASPMITSTYS
jgi:hypothetical protein